MTQSSVNYAMHKCECSAKPQSKFALLQPTRRGAVPQNQVFLRFHDIVIIITYLRHVLESASCILAQSERLSQFSHVFVYRKQLCEF
jgi:hypothetical protein